MAEISCILGMRSDILNNVLVVDEQTIIYPYGTNCVLYNIGQKHQKYLQVLERKAILSVISISPNRRYLAVAERGNDEGEKPAISIFDISVLRRRKALSNVENVQCLEYKSLSFSSDSKFIAALIGHPDSLLQIWAWEKSKIAASIIVATAQIPQDVFQVNFNPSENTQLCVTCHGSVKFFKYSDGTLKQTSNHKLENVNYNCQAWLSGNQSVVSSENGRLMFFSGTELRYEVDVASKIMDRRKEEEEEEEEEEKDNSDDFQSSPSDDGGTWKNKSISNLISFSKGFIFCFGHKTVHVHEGIEGFNYRETKRITIPENMNCTKGSRHFIRGLSLSPSEEFIVCSTSGNQIFSSLLYSTEIDKIDQNNFELLCFPFHSDRVTSIDISPRKPIVASCSLDGHVKIWNFEERTLELSIKFAEEAHSLSLHPLGHHIIVGFTSRLKLMSILSDHLEILKEFNVKSCQKCCFSNGGHMMCAINDNIISIFSTTTFENVTNLKGHGGGITGLTWSKNDAKIFSCGADGTVYEWNVLSGNRTGEVISKSCSYNDVVVSSDGKSVFAVGSDMMLKEIVGSQIVRTLDVGDKSITSMSVTGKSLIIGTSTGLVRFFMFPLVSLSDSTDRLLHVDSITGIKMSHDGQHIMTSSTDGGVVMWRLKEEFAGSKLRRDVLYTNDVLISKADLVEKDATMNDLKTRIEELKLKNEYQLRVQGSKFNEKINELTDKFVEELDSLRNNNQKMKVERDKIVRKHEEQVKELITNQDFILQEVESKNNQKLMMQYEKYQELQNKSQKMQDEHEKKKMTAEEEKKGEICNLTKSFEGRIAILNEQIERMNKDAKRRQQETEEVIRQMEEDADLEVVMTKNQFQKKLKDESEMCDKLRGQVGVMSKTFVSLRKEIEDGKEEFAKGQVEVQKLRQMIKNLEKDIKALKREVKERDETIQDKEKQIHELKKITQDLEKFKFVLDYNIKELKNQIEPKGIKILSMEEQIEEMENELNKHYKVNSQLEINLTCAKQKLSAAEKSMLKERHKVYNMEMKIKRIKEDIHLCVGNIEDPKFLRSSLIAIHSKHMQNDDDQPLENVAEECLDFAKQRDFLERSMASLIKKHKRESNQQNSESTCVLQQNVKLIREVNELRNELKVATSKIKNLESFSSVNIYKKHSSSHQKSLLEFTAEMNMTNFLNLQRELQEKNKLVELQHEEIVKLRNISQTFKSLKPYSVCQLSPITID